MISKITRVVPMGLAATLVAIAMSGCSSPAAVQPTTTQQFNVEGVGTVNVTMDNTHGYTMQDSVFVKDGKRAAQLNFLSESEFATYQSEAPNEDNYHAIEIRGSRGFYFESTDKNGNRGCYYVVSVPDASCYMVVAALDEQSASDALNLVSASKS